MSSPETPEVTAPRKNKTLIATLIVVFVLAGVFAVMLLATGKVGTTEVTAAGITKYIARVDGDAELRLPIRLLEGTDAGHEADHIFPIYEALGGVEKVTVLPDGSAVVITYASDAVTPQVLTQATAESGYLTQGQ